MRKITDRQRKALGRMMRACHGQVTLSPDLAKQLLKRGLVTKEGTWQPKEWNRPTATLWVCSITETGRETYNKENER